MTGPNGRRTRCMSAFGALPVVCALVLLAHAGTSRAESAGQRDYLVGVRLIADGDDYEGAVKKLRSAIKEDPVEGIQKFRATGVLYEDYLPHYWLGFALAKLGQTDEALKELKESESQGAVKKKDKLYKDLQSQVVRLQAIRLAQVKPTPVPTQPPPTPVPPTPVPQAATPRPQPTAIRIEHPTAAAPTVPPTPSPARKETPTKAILNIAPPPTASAAVDRTPSPPPANTRDALRDGLRLYFAGRYGEAAKKLDPIAKDSPTARLYLAYSLASQALLAEDSDRPALGKRARAEYAKAREAGAPAGDPGLISPGVLNILTTDSPR